MRTIPAGFLDSSVTRLQVCWRIVRRDDEVIYGTEYDQNIAVTTGDYTGTYLREAGITGSDIRSADDLSVDNLEITGALVDTAGDTSATTILTLVDISAADIEAGVFDNAEAVVFLVNSDDPDLYQHVLRTGWLGSVKRTAEGKWTTELRGLTQALSQTIVRTYSVACDAELGDARCKVDLSQYTVSSFVDQTDSRRRFKVDGDAGDLASQPATEPGEGIVKGGKITWTSGANTGYSMEVKDYGDDDGPFWVILFLPMPKDIELGDTFTFTAGCDKTYETCRDHYNNLLNRRAHGLFVPGELEVLKVGKRR